MDQRPAWKRADEVGTAWRQTVCGRAVWPAQSPSIETVRLTEAELGCVDDLWRATVLRYALQILRGDMATNRDESELQWCVKQVEKATPFAF
jgi:hypothetical protein